MTTDRREAVRIPESRLITEIVAERPNVASIVNVSRYGMFTVKPSRIRVLDSGIKRIQLEIPIPEANETIWATGQLIFERSGLRATGSGIRFLAMADRHRRLIRDMVEYRRQLLLERMIREIERRRELARYPSPFTLPPPPPSQDTVKMYILPGAR